MCILNADKNLFKDNLQGQNPNQRSSLGPRLKTFHRKPFEEDEVDKHPNPHFESNTEKHSSNDIAFRESQN